MSGENKKTEKIEDETEENVTEEEMKEFRDLIQDGARKHGFEETQLSQEDWNKRFPLDTDKNIEEYIINMAGVCVALGNIDADTEKLLSEQTMFDMIHIVKSIKEHHPKIKESLLATIVTSQLIAYENGFRSALRLAQSIMAIEKKQSIVETEKEQTPIAEIANKLLGAKR